jgi:hypothetical protein
MKNIISNIMFQQVQPKTREQQQGKAITLALTFDLLNEMNTPGFMSDILQALLLDKYQVRHTNIHTIQKQKIKNHYTS